MCFRRSPSDKPPPAPPSRSPCVLATRLPVWWDDVYNNGERQSNFTQHARQGSHLSARPPRHIWKEMRLKTTLTSCTGRRAKKGVGGQGQRRATHGRQTQFHLGRALVKMKKYHTLLRRLSFLLSAALRQNWISYRRSCHSHTQARWNPHAGDPTDFFTSPDTHHHTWYGPVRMRRYHLTPLAWCVSFHWHIANVSKLIWPNMH